MNYMNAHRGRIVESSSAPAAALQPSASATHQEIARAAFGHWKSHGGDAEQNWLLCERRFGDRKTGFAETPSPILSHSL